uniref:beta-ketoacyl reductase n=1 Tax=Frankia sp. Cr1 TaxID=3073931 RepID=UPI002AD35CBF
IQITMDRTRDGALSVLIADAGGDAGGNTVARLAGLRLAEMGSGATMETAGPHNLVHEVTWRPLALPDPATAGSNGAAGAIARDVVFVGEESSLVVALCTRLTASGSRCQVVSGPEDLRDLTEPADVLVLPLSADPGEPVGRSAARSAWLLTEIAQRMAGPHRAKSARLWCLTIGVRESRDEGHLTHSPLWGLGRIMAGEHSQLWGGVVDLPPDDPATAAETLLQVLRAAPAEDVIALRDGVASVARLALTSREPVRAPLACRSDGTYLITGGLGVLGLRVAHWLAERGARRIVLVGRHGLPPRALWDTPADGPTRRKIAEVRALEAAGVTIRVLSLDIADAEQAARRLASDALDLPPIRGVVHAAGVLDNRLVMGVDEKSLRAVLRPKVDGALVLHRLFPPGSLDFLVLFSSCGQLLGMPGQAAYGSANAFLDAFAVHRNGSAATVGQADTLSLGWTSWRGHGMAVNDVVDAELRARGVTAISAAEAFDAWDFADRRGPGHYPVLRTVQLEPGAERPPLLSDISAPVDGLAPDASAEPFADLPPELLRGYLLDDVGTQISAEMKLPTTALDPRRSLIEQGLDSVMTIMIRRRLERRFGQKLPATLLWQQPTVTAITDHLVELLRPAEPTGAEPTG